LIAPYGGKLVELLVPPESAEDARAEAGKLPSLQLTDRAVCDLEMLATGAFSPLDRFMSEADHRRVLDEMRLESAHVFPIPVTLSVDKDDPAVRLDSEVALRDSKNELVGTMTIEVFVDRPLSVCEERDSKGIYARARRGEIKGVTGIDDPYESPLRPEIALDTVGSTVEQNSRLILELITERGFIRDDADGAAGA